MAKNGSQVDFFQSSGRLYHFPLNVPRITIEIKNYIYYKRLFGYRLDKHLNK